MSGYRVDPDVRSAETLPGAYYRDEKAFARTLDRIARRHWHYLGEASLAASPGDVAPVTLFDEPLLLTRDEGGLHLVSNVCTHRGAILVEKPCRSPGLRCRYHGRRFSLDGRFVSMPEFDDALGFPRAADDLPRAHVHRFGPMLFAALHPAASFDAVLAPLRARAGALRFDEAVIDPSGARDYEVAAHWALYVDNYLEGFHVPFVHPSLNAILDYRAYATECFEGGNVQIGYADEGAYLPGHDRVAALYFWFFPGTMINVYPWGISLNVVQPLAIDRTRVLFRRFLFPDHEAPRDGAGADLHRVELEDEAVVESVQRGIRARLYRSGRFSPARERGVHQFHRLLADLSLE